ncbi:hypothetical protein BC628DRAFT_905762 [Trametes gibbosa]|nr:hypothetical protein BC628DRAFT_905762 [Trametes gibbosa]
MHTLPCILRSHTSSTPIHLFVSSVYTDSCTVSARSILTGFGSHQPRGQPPTRIQLGSAPHLPPLELVALHPKQHHETPYAQNSFALSILADVPPITTAAAAVQCSAGTSPELPLRWLPKMKPEHPRV